MKRTLISLLMTAALLLSRPNEHMTAYEMRRAIFADKYLYDMHLSIIVPDADAPSGWAMWRVPPEWVDGYVGGNAWAPDSFIIDTPDKRRIEVPRDVCLWLHGYDPTDPMRQTSPVESLRDLLGEQIESGHFRRQMWQRGGRFNAYLTRPKDVEKWTQDAFDRFKRSWNESWAGRDGSDAGAMPILEDGMEIRQMQFNAKDANKVVEDEMSVEFESGYKATFPVKGEALAEDVLFYGFEKNPLDYVWDEDFTTIDADGLVNYKSNYYLTEIENDGGRYAFTLGKFHL